MHASEIAASRGVYAEQSMLKVPSYEIQQRAEQLKIPFVECSAMLGRNVENAFYELVRQVRKFQAAERPPIKPSKSKPRRRCTIL